MTIHVVGGVDSEYCVRPEWNSLSDSAGHATFDIAKMVGDGNPHSYFTKVTGEPNHVADEAVKAVRKAASALALRTPNETYLRLENAPDDEGMKTDQPTCRRRNHVYAAYVNAALVIRTFDLRQAENLLLREGVPRKVIARVVLAGQPCRNVTPSSWAQQFCR